MKRTYKYILGACLLLSLFLSLGAAVYHTDPLAPSIKSIYEPLKLVIAGFGLIGVSSLLRRHTTGRIKSAQTQ